jgi:hypothetical protein
LSTLRRDVSFELRRDGKTLVRVEEGVPLYSEDDESDASEESPGGG